MHARYLAYRCAMSVHWTTIWSRSYSQLRFHLLGPFTAKPNVSDRHSESKEGQGLKMIQVKRVLGSAFCSYCMKAESLPGPNHCAQALVYAASAVSTSGAEPELQTAIGQAPLPWEGARQQDRNHPTQPQPFNTTDKSGERLDEPIFDPDIVRTVSYGEISAAAGDSRLFGHKVGRHLIQTSRCGSCRRADRNEQPLSCQEDAYQWPDLPTWEELYAGVYLRLTLLPADALDRQLASVAQAFHNSSTGSVLYTR